MGIRRLDTPQLRHDQRNMAVTGYCPRKALLSKHQHTNWGNAMTDKKTPKTAEQAKKEGMRELTGGELIEVSGAGIKKGGGKGGKGSLVTRDPDGRKLTSE